MKKLAFASSSSSSFSFFAATAISLALSLPLGCGGSSSDGSNTDTSGTSPSGNGSSGGGGSSGDVSCGATTKALCAKACACAGNGKCTISYGAATETHDSQDKCETFYAFLVCGDSKYAPQFEGSTCRAAVDAASCTSTGPAGSGVTFPAQGCPKK